MSPSHKLVDKLARDVRQG
uniref:Uncharacterized protein n=1 Tax=Anguilla anguilla TaxID=7936 RepID=A0A0E9U0Y1_ANGAN